MTTVEILLMVGGKSGVELALNRVANYLADYNCIIRFVQVISTDYPWATDKAEFFCLDMNSDIDMQNCILAYQEHIRKAGKPDIILVAGMPVAVYIAKGALANLGIDDCITVAWPHNDLSFYSDDHSEIARELDFADMIFAISDKIASEAANMCPGKIIYRVNNTIDTDKILFSDNRNSQKIAFIGRLSPEKNIGDIIRAISLANSNWELYIIGDGDERQFLEGITASLNLTDKVHFLGWLADPYKEIPDVRAMVMTSSTEGAPLSTIEALACGMQVISTPVGFNPEVITSDENGYIFSGDIPKELAGVLDMLAKEEYKQETAYLCRDSVSDYMPDVALWDFLCKTVASSRLIGLPQRNWENKETRLVRKGSGYNPML